eukprot:15356028-Alexandrium_andersonii.AAC.1
MREVLSNLPDIDVEEHLRLLQRRPMDAPTASAGASGAAPETTASTSQPPIAVFEEEYSQCGMCPP